MDSFPETSVDPNVSYMNQKDYSLLTDPVKDFIASTILPLFQAFR